MVQPIEQLKQLTFQIPLCDITMRAKLEICQAVSINDKPVFNKNIHLNFTIFQKFVIDKTT